MERMMPLCAMSAASQFNALSGWENCGGQVLKVTSNPSRSRNPPATET